MPSKVNTARVILVVLGWIEIVAAVIFFLMFLFSSVLIGTSGEQGAVAGSAIFGVVGLVVALVLVAFGVIYLLTAKGVKEKKNWAKILGIIVGVLSLFSFPIGTILGIFILIGLTGDEANSWFETTTPQA